MGDTQRAVDQDEDGVVALPLFDEDVTRLEMDDGVTVGRTVRDVEKLKNALYHRGLRISLCAVARREQPVPRGPIYRIDSPR